MKTLALVVLLFVATAFAQDEEVTVEPMTKGEIQLLGEANQLLELAQKNLEDSQKQVAKDHGAGLPGVTVTLQTGTVQITRRPLND